MKLLINLVFCSCLINVGQSSLCPVGSTILQNSNTFWCVWIIDSRHTLSVMVTECSASDGFVLVVKDDNVQTFLQQKLGPMSMGIAEEIWINYNTTSDTSLEGDPLSNTYWESTPSAGLPCVIARYPDYLWNSVECGVPQRHYGICYKEINCKPEGGYYMMSHDICYWLGSGMHNAAESETVCNMDGGTLAVIPDQVVMAALANNTEIQSVISTKHYYRQCWLGINDLKTEGIFTNKTGGIAPYLFWQYGQPTNYNNQDCVVLNKQFSTVGMADEDCNEPGVPLCFGWNGTGSVYATTTTITQTSTVSVTGTTTGTVSIPTSSSTTTQTSSTQPVTGTKTGTVSVPTRSSTTTQTSTTQPVTDIPILCCPCPKKTYNTEYVNNTAALTQQLMKLKKETILHLKNTSAYRNSLMCAKDDRPSAVSIGISASVIMFSALGMILLMDISTMTHSLACPLRPKIR